MSREETQRLRSSALYWSAAEALLLASQLPLARLPSAAEVRQQRVSMLDRMVATARAARVPDADIAEARYALVAFMDEQILKSEWAGRTEWMQEPLQLQLYREYTAGENFFVRLRSLLSTGNRTFALEVYYLCLALGFRGASGAQGEGSSPSSFTDTARSVLAKTYPYSNHVSPNARLRDHARPERHSRAPIIAWVVACAALAGGTYLGLHWTIGRAVQSTVEQVPALDARQP
jgi:type VI secretion system protein ImpK